MGSQMTRNSMQAGDGGDRVTGCELDVVVGPKARAYVRLHEPMSIILSKNQNCQRRGRIYAGKEKGRRTRKRAACPSTPTCIRA